MAAIADAGPKPAENEAELSTHTTEPSSASSTATAEAPQNTTDSTDQSPAEAGAAVEIPSATDSPEAFLAWMDQRKEAAEEGTLTVRPTEEKAPEAVPAQTPAPTEESNTGDDIDLERLPDRQRIQNELSRVAVAIQRQTEQSGESISLGEAENRAAQAFPHLAPKKEDNPPEPESLSLPEGVPSSVAALDSRIAEIMGEDGEMDRSIDEGNFIVTSELKSEVGRLQAARDQVRDYEDEQEQQGLQAWQAERDRTYEAVVELYPDANNEESDVYRRANEILHKVTDAAVRDHRFLNEDGDLLPSAAAQAIQLAAAEAGLAPGERLAPASVKPPAPKATTPKPPSSPGLAPSPASGGSPNPSTTLTQEINEPRTPDEWVAWFEGRNSRH